MTTIKDIIEHIIDVEGGYVNDPNDLGGATKFGITEKVARENGYTGEMVDLPRKVAYNIYEKRYYHDPGYHLLAVHSTKVAHEIVDTAVNMGIKKSSEFIQRLLNVLNRQEKDYKDLVVDGRVGRQTAAAMKAFLQKRGYQGELVLLRGLNCLQGARYIEICEARERNEAFLFGWLANRVVL